MKLFSPREIKRKRVCVVGGAGFLGSHLVNHLIEDRDCEVIVVDNLVVGKREYVHRKAKFEWFDITGSEHHFRSILETYNVEYVFNYAAMPYIPTSFKRPLRVFDVNATGALKVINASQDAGVKAILQVSSAEIYGEGSCSNSETEWSKMINESAPVLPHSTYGAAKAAIDNLIQVRWKESKTPCISLRQFNCIGERETHPYVVPEIVSQLSRGDSHNSDLGKPPRVFLGNNSVRDFQYAGDAVRNAVLLLEEGEFGEVYNMGSESCIRIYDLAKMIGEVMKLGPIEVVSDPGRIRPWEIWHLQSDNTKLWNTIGKQPVTDLKTALRLTVSDFYASDRKWSWE